MIIGFGNNVVSSLAADITATQTTIQVMPGAGALFSGLLTYDYANDSNPLKVYAKITLTDAKETVFEVCHLTSVSNDMLTVVRGQEGTTAKGWSLNDVIANFATRGSESQFIQIEQLQSGHYTAAVAGGTPNALTLELPATYFLNGSTDWALRAPIIVYPIQNNTGDSTLQLTMGGRVLGVYPLVKGSNTALRAGDIVAKSPFLTLFNAEQGRFSLLNPTTNIGSVLTVNSKSPDAGGNVKLGSASDADVGTNPGNVMAVGAFGLGAGATPRDDAYTTVAEIYRVNNASNNRPGNGVYGVISLPCDGGPTTAYLAVSSNGEVYAASSQPNSALVWARIYTKAFKPTASDVGAYPITGGYIQGNATAIGNLSAQNGSILINDKDGVRLFELAAAIDGSVTFTSLLTGKGFSIDNNGHLTTYLGSQLLESGQRVYSPNNPPPAESTFTDVSGNWINTNRRSGMIMQGGIVYRTGDTTNVSFPTAFPGTCSAVFITQIAQSGSSADNIIVTSRSLAGFTLLMRSNETAASWMAIGA